MTIVHRLEKKMLGWVKDVPHVTADVQAWLGRNIWLVVLIGSIVGGISLFFQFISWITLIQLLNNPVSQLYVYGGISGWSIAVSAVSYSLSILLLVMLFAAVSPLKRQTKKGWVLLFVAWMLFVASIVINAVLSLSSFTFIMTLLLGGTFAAILGYILFEIHEYFDTRNVIAVKAKPSKEA